MFQNPVNRQQVTRKRKLICRLRGTAIFFIAPVSMELEPNDY
jgi:hypothetical protein